jgi:outer membrane protein assembly factor BamD (BamD/ComL family)
MEQAMSVSATSTSATPLQPPPPNAAFRTAFQQLTTAIGSGDLGAAQKAYASLQQTTGSSAPQGPMAQLMSSIGDALSSGKIEDAQSALTAFQQAHPHKHHAKPPADDDSAPSSAPPAVASGSNQIDVSV